MTSAPRHVLSGLTLALTLACHHATPVRASDRYEPHPRSHDAPRVDTASLLRELDQRAAAAAAARPSFAFPARIGVARIENGAVTAIPADEWPAWRALRDQMTPALGELTPVSAIVAQSLTTAPVSGTPHDTITHLRLAAAREQLDAILLYEVSTTHSLEQTELTLLDATIVGAWWFPTHRSHATVQSSATLIDVRSGLAYGSALGHATDACSATLFGSAEKIHRQRAATARKSVTALAPEVGDLMARLAQSSPRHVARDEHRTTDRQTIANRTATRPAVSEIDGEDDRVIPPPKDGGDSFWSRR